MREKYYVMQRALLILNKITVDEKKCNFDRIIGYNKLHGTYVGSKFGRIKSA